MIYSLTYKCEAQETWMFNNTTWQMYSGISASTQFLFAKNGIIDTLISGNIYKKINGCDSLYKFGVRSYNRKVYLVPKDSLNEYLLYDFSVGVGDSVYNLVTGNSISVCEPDLTLKTAIVTDVDSFSINSRMYSIIHVQGVGGIDDVWFENVGSWNGFLYYTNVTPLSNLQCYSNNDTTINLSYLFTLPHNGEEIPIIQSNTCNDSIVSIGESGYPKFSLNIYPSPSNSKIIVETNNSQDNLCLKILDILGNEIYFFEKINFITEVDISQLPSGIYILQMQSKNGVQSKKFVKE